MSFHRFASEKFQEILHPSFFIILFIISEKYHISKGISIKTCGICQNYGVKALSDTAASCLIWPKPC